MAATKKKAAPVTEEKVEAAVKAEVKETTVKAEPVKETAEKAAKTTAKKAKATTTKATTKKTTKDAELKSELHIQFGGKSYGQDELVKIAKDVWEYDLNQKADDLTSVELYVKPEENTVYYVMNKEFNGSFSI